MVLVVYYAVFFCWIAIAIIVLLVAWDSMFVIIATTIYLWIGLYFAITGEYPPDTSEGGIVVRGILRIFFWPVLCGSSD